MNHLTIDDTFNIIYFFFTFSFPFIYYKTECNIYTRKRKKTVI